MNRDVWVGLSIFLIGLGFLSGTWVYHARHQNHLVLSGHGFFGDCCEDAGSASLSASVQLEVPAILSRASAQDCRCAIGDQGRSAVESVWACLGVFLVIVGIHWREFREQWMHAWEAARDAYADRYQELQALDMRAGKPSARSLKMRALRLEFVMTFLALASGAAAFMDSIRARLGV